MANFQTLPEALQHWARERADRAAFIFRDQHGGRTELTWGQLWTLSGRWAASLREQGTARGDLVINTLPNSPERVVCEAAIWMAGAASVNAQCLMADGSDLLHTVSRSRAPIMLLDPDVTNSPWCVLKNHVNREEGGQVTSSSLRDLKRIVFVRRVAGGQAGDFLGELKKQEDWFCANDITADDVFSVFSTSGSTGFSKLVVRTQGRFISFLRKALGSFEEFIDDGVNLNPGQMGWFGGSLVDTVVTGKPRVACDNRAGVPDNMAQFLWSCIQQERCRSANIQPVYVAEIAKIAQREHHLKEGTGEMPSLWKLDALGTGGQPIYKHVVDAGLTFARSFASSYGATDFGMVSGMLIANSDDYTDLDTGPPLPGVQVKIVSSEDESKPCASGQNGMILVKGSNMMKAYLNDAKSTADAFTADGFFRTGDVGRLDDRGHLLVEGRGSDAIMRGAYIFYPTWIENTIRSCLGVSDVVVCGVPDVSLREELCACVILESADVSLDSVQKSAEEKFLSRDDVMSACPRYFLSFENFSLTDTGKLTRKHIKAQAARRLGLCDDGSVRAK